MSENKYRIEISKTLPATPELVFDAWLSPESIQKWMCPGEGVTVPEPKIDAREGGAFDVTMKVGEQLIPHSGVYKKLNRPHELQFTWKSPGTHDLDTLVTIQIEGIESNQAKLTLIHDLLPSEKAQQDHTGGCTRILECLDGALKE